MIYLGICLSALLLFAIMNALSKNKKPFKRAFLNMLLGIVSLIAVNIFGIYFDISLPISPLSFTVSACGGVPAVAAMVIINTLL